MLDGKSLRPNASLLEGYSDRMIRCPRFVREGNRLIPEAALVTVRREDPPSPQQEEGADAPSQE